MAAPFVPIPGIARVSVEGLFGGVKTANVFWVGDTGTSLGYSQTEIDFIATSVRGFYATRFAPLLANGWSHTQTIAVDQTSEFGLAGIATTAVNGTDGTQVFTSATAQGITWKIARRYRGGHPRTYLPPPGNGAAMSAGSTWSATRVSGLLAAATGFLTDVNGSSIAGRSFPLVCVHREKGRTPLVPRLVDRVLAATVDSRPDTQRRRLGRDR